jgi:hypothetical protein
MTGGLSVGRSAVALLYRRVARCGQRRVAGQSGVACSSKYISATQHAIPTLRASYPFHTRMVPSAPVPVSSTTAH